MTLAWATHASTLVATPFYINKTKCTVAKIVSCVDTDVDFASPLRRLGNIGRLFCFQLKQSNIVGRAKSWSIIRH